MGDAHAGTKRSSNKTNFDINLRKASGSKVGKAIREAELFMRAIFLSGRNRLIFPSLFLYAFMPSKHSNA